MSQQLKISEGETYDHDEHGMVTVLSLWSEVLSLNVERNDDRTTTKVEPSLEWYVEYDYDGGIRMDSAKLEDFQHKLPDQ